MLSIRMENYNNYALPPSVSLKKFENPTLAVTP